MPVLNPGSLNRRITITRPSTTADDDGTPLNVWTHPYTYWASLTGIASKEMYSIGGFTSQVTHKVTIRYTKTPIVAGDRVTCGTQTLKVQAVSDPDGLRAQLNLYCLDSTVVPNG